MAKTTKTLNDRILTNDDIEAMKEDVRLDEQSHVWGVPALEKRHMQAVVAWNDTNVGENCKGDDSFLTAYAFMFENDNVMSKKNVAGNRN